MKKMGVLIVLVLLLSLSHTAAHAQSLSPGCAHRLIVQPDDGRTALLQALDGAKESIALTIYEIDDPEINAALIRAARRGVKVRILYNYYSFCSMGREYRLEPVIKMFEAAGILLCRAPQEFTITHQKTFTLDGKLSLIMSFNLQPNYFSATRDFAIITTVSDEVGEIARVFEADWNARDIRPVVPSLVWSPVNSRQKILTLIAGSTKTLDVYNEEAEDRQILQALIDAAGRGVKMRFISARLGERGMDRNQWGRDLLNAHGVNAQCVTSLYIHAKKILADFNTPRAQAFIGSENFSRTSLDRNRELGIVVTEAEILERLHGTFEKDWGQ